MVEVSSLSLTITCSERDEGRLVVDNSDRQEEKTTQLPAFALVEKKGGRKYM